MMFTDWTPNSCPSSAAPSLFSGHLEATTTQELFEKVPEFCVKDGIDDGVESAVDVAQPCHHAHQRHRDMTVLATGPQGVKDKEGGPAEQEGTCETRG